MKELRFAIFGTGYWARYQLAAWRELEGARCVALYNRTVAKAEALARELGVPAVYGDPEELLEKERPDFIDVITDVGTHDRFVALAAERRVPVICQKPMARSLEEAERMVATCRVSGVPFFVHENWRWQTPLRAFKAVLAEGRLGRPFRASIDFSSSFPVFENQPSLKDLEEFILTDIGSHILDVARFLFGEATELACQTQRIHADIRGEDVATVLLRMGGGMTVVATMSYASRTERERFPETFALVECEGGSVELAPDFWIRVTDAGGTEARRHPPPTYPWGDPRYALVQSSIVPCNADLLRAVREGTLPETHGEDNLKTVRLVFGAYRSARTAETVRFANP
jgi:predicted dehydrogenase